MNISLFQSADVGHAEWCARVREELQQIAASNDGFKITHAMVTTSQGWSAGSHEVLTVGVQVAGGLAVNILASYLYDLIKGGSVKAFLKNIELSPDRELIQLRLSEYVADEVREKDAASGSLGH